MGDTKTPPHPRRRLDLFGSSAPACGHEEADERDAQADEEVPRAETGNRVSLPADVVHEDPHEAEQHETHHDGLEPRRVRRGLALDPLDDGFFALTGTCHADQCSGRGRRP
ncbi:hypothetical protein ABE10_01840 [Bacillus toyonensis]|nr:hypothetical protein [Bacillus toyonensis]